MKKLFITPLAELDVKEAYDWYELNRNGLGEKFMDLLKGKLQTIQSSPSIYPIKHNRIKMAVMEVFPFAIYFRDETDRIVVISIYHFKRNPKKAFKRAK